MATPSAPTAATFPASKSDPGLPTDPIVARSLNAQIVANYSQFGNQTSNPQFQNPYIYNPKLNFTRIQGRSTYKVGYEYQAIFITIDDFNPIHGQDTYNGGFSFTGASSSALSNLRPRHPRGPSPSPTSSSVRATPFSSTTSRSSISTSVCITSTFRMTSASHPG